MIKNVKEGSAKLLQTINKTKTTKYIQWIYQIYPKLVPFK